MQADIAPRLDKIESFLPELEAQLLEIQNQDLKIETKSTEVDLVTRADLHSESALCQFIREHFPADGILAEEGNATGCATPSEESILWVLDPIDGTVNYAHKLPHRAISIGLVQGQKPLGAIVSAPALGWLYRAELGGGAFKNGKPIQVCQSTTLRQGLVATGFPYDRAERAEPLSRALENMLKVSGGIRRNGAASLDFCHVADGRFVAYYEMALKPWDSAAGCLIVTEAGGQVTSLTGQEFDLFASPGALASNGEVHEELIREAAPILEAL